MVLSVLIVDDSPSVLGMLSAVLSARGFLVLEAKDGGEALSALAGNSVDVVITDLLMPGMDGIELTREIRRMHEGEKIPVLMFTTQTSEALRQAGEDAGVTSWLVKPVPPARLAALIRKAAADVKTAR